MNKIYNRYKMRDLIIMLIFISIVIVSSLLYNIPSYAFESELVPFELNHIYAKR